MDRDPDLHYIAITPDLNDSIAKTSQQLLSTAMDLAHSTLPSNTTLDAAYAWTLCVCAATLARCLALDPRSASRNAISAHNYVLTLLRDAEQTVH